MIRILAFTWLFVTVGLIRSSLVRSQDEPNDPIRLMSLSPIDIYPFVSDSWVTWEISLENRSRASRDVRILVSYADQADVQYGRDVWLPGRSRLSTWMLIGPAPKQASEEGGTSGRPRGSPISGSSNARELRILLYDRTGGQERLVLPPEGERTRSRLAPYQPRQPRTCLILNADAFSPAPDALEISDPFPPRDLDRLDVVQLVRAFRHGCGLSGPFPIVPDLRHTPTADALAGVDHIILASAQLADDLPSERAIRSWLAQGGKLWIMLDAADIDMVSRLLGGGFQVVDRTRLTKVQIENANPGPENKEATAHELEQPVDLVRVLLDPDFTVLHTVNGWPASFIRRVGRGKVLITTLGAAGWLRPRTQADLRSPLEDFPDFPVPVPAMDRMTQELQPPPKKNPFPGNSLEPLVMGDIGYSIMGAGTATLIFAGFVASTLSAGILLRRRGRMEVLGWFGPTAAIGAAGIFIWLGDQGRRSLPPTVAVAQIVDVIPGAPQQPVVGLLGVYRPESGPAPFGSDQGGLLDLDLSGLEGQTNRFVMADLDAWHWENLSLPAGVRLAPFQYLAPTDNAIRVRAQFGPNGLEGRVIGIPRLADSLLHCPTGRDVALKLREDGTFAIGDENLLPKGQYLSGALWTDRQQRRQAVYRRALAETERMDLQHSALMGWTEPMTMPFSLFPGARMVGSALLTIPLEFEPTPPGTRVRVATSFVPFRRIHEGVPIEPLMDGQRAIDMHLRFQIPPSILPVRVERAQLLAKIDAPFRRITVAGRALEKPSQRDGQRLVLWSAENSIGRLRLDIARPEVLRLDEHGGLHLDVGISEMIEDPERKRPEAENLGLHWTIHSLELEIIGQTLPQE